MRASTLSEYGTPLIPSARFWSVQDTAPWTTIDMFEEVSVPVLLVAEILKVKNEILNSPCKIEETKKELEEKIKSMNINFAGVLKETRVLSNENRINNIKIGHIVKEIKKYRGDF